MSPSVWGPRNRNQFHVLAIHMKFDPTLIGDDRECRRRGPETPGAPFAPGAGWSQPSCAIPAPGKDHCAYLSEILSTTQV